MTLARRLASDDRDDLAMVLGLIRTEFSYMDGLVDPPSSMHRLTIADLGSGPGEVWVVGDPPVACIVMTPKDEALYVGKLAVAGPAQGTGLARLLLDRAERRAIELGLESVELQTRIELTDNHAAFAAMGFIEVERTAHAGYSHPTSITYRRAVSPLRH